MYNLPFRLTILQSGVRFLTDALTFILQDGFFICI